MSKKFQYIIGVASILTLGVVAAYLTINQEVFSLQRVKNRLQTSPKQATQALEVNTQPASDNSFQNNKSLSRYENAVFGFSFDNNNGVVTNRSDESENLNQIEVYYDQQSRIFITHEVNPKPINPKDWFETNRNKYNDLIVENGLTQIQGQSTLFLGIPNTCRSVPVLIAIISKDNEIFTFSHFEAASRSYAVELEQILESLVFKDQTEVPQSIPKQLFEFPKPPANISCS